MVRAGHGSRTPGAAPANIHVKAKLLQTRVAKEQILTTGYIHCSFDGSSLEQLSTLYWGDN